MSTETNIAVVDELSNLLLATMMLAKAPPVPAHFASVDSFLALHADLISLREILYAASNGDLSRPVSFKGYIAGTLKTLQANLRHMTWQTKMVASGDFTQRIEFMGEFSQSFNAMVMQLDQTLKALVRKETELSQAYEELLKEIDARKQTEAALRESEGSLRLLAITDPLTGLYNRRHFFELAEAEIGKALRYSRPLSVIMFDIDFFKRINDTFGHPCGDRVLQMIATTTKQTLRDADITARYGGEEFVILLPETPAPQAAIIAERLRGHIGTASVPSENSPVTITASFGVSDYVGKANSKSREKALSAIINNADQALYASKKGGRNRVTVYKPEENSVPYDASGNH